LNIKILLGKRKESWKKKINELQKELNMTKTFKKTIYYNELIVILGNTFLHLYAINVK
jgi:hypothetical protein